MRWQGISHRRLARLWPGVASLAAAAVVLAGHCGCDEGERPLAVWCETGAGPGQLMYPRAIAYSAGEDCFFVVDRTARIQRLDAAGRCALWWRMPEWENGKPVGLSIGPDGNLYVADTHYHRVMVYASDGRFVRQWGSYGSGPGQFMYPTDVAFDGAGNIYVSEYGDDNDRIQVFEPRQLRVLRAIGRPGSGEGEFSRPQSIMVMDNCLYVADSGNHRIAVFDLNGRFARNLCAPGCGLGELRFPYGLDVDLKGHLVVAEFGNNRVQVIDRHTGRGLRVWGRPGREEGQLAYPWALAVDKRGRVVVVDSGNNRLQVVGL